MVEDTVSTKGSPALDANCNTLEPVKTARDEIDGLSDFDDLLPHIGEFGLYQKLLFLMMIPFTFSVAFVYFTQIFLTLVPEEHWCMVPELQHLPLSQRLSLSVPRGEDGSYDKCRMYVADWSQVLARNMTEADPKWPTAGCNKWQYQFDDIPYPTIATELDWVCDDAALPSAAQSVFFLGAIAGGLIFGWLADRYGRIPALVGANVVGLVGGIMTAWSYSFWFFTLSRFVVGLAFDNCFTMMYILVLEYVGPKWRTFVANMSIALFFTMASVLLPWMAIFISDWRVLSMVTSIPMAVAIFTPWTVPESARWLVSQNKMEKAISILKKFERINKKSVDPNIYAQYNINAQKQNAEEAGKKYSVLDLFKTPRLRNITILLIVIWMCISLVFDGHVRNVGSLGLNVFLTFTIACATELPADTFLTLVLDRWGRRWLAFSTMALSGVFSLLAAAVEPGVPTASLAIMGRFAVNITYNIGLQYAAELLPTVVRAQGVALIHIMGYVASILSPFVVYLANIDVNLPLYVLGTLGIFGGLMSLYLPETMDQELPQSLKEGEQFGLGQKFWDLPCLKKSIDEGPTNPEIYRKRGSSAIRASIRGEHFRSSLINRSRRSRDSETGRNNAIPEAAPASVIAV